MKSLESSRRFYKEDVAGLIHTKFGEYEDRIAVGIAGEGSDCFGYDDHIMRLGKQCFPNSKSTHRWIPDAGFILAGHSI
jgi:hypothetical protein